MFLLKRYSWSSRQRPVRIELVLGAANPGEREPGVLAERDVLDAAAEPARVAILEIVDVQVVAVVEARPCPERGGRLRGPHPARQGERLAQRERGREVVAL